MEINSITSLVVIFVLVVGVQCSGSRRGGPDNKQQQSGPANIPQRPLLPPILNKVNRTELKNAINAYNNMSAANRHMWNIAVFHVGPYNEPLVQHPPPGVSPEVFQKYSSMSGLKRRLWFDLLHSGGILPGQYGQPAAPNNETPSPLLPNLKRQHDDASGSGNSQRSVGRAFRMNSQPEKGKNKMTSIPSQHKQSAVRRGFAGTSRQPNFPIQSSYGRSNPGLALAINENLDNTRAPAQALRPNNVYDDPPPRDFLSLAVDENSNYTGE